MESPERKYRRKKKPSQKTAERNYDLYFGDLTKFAPPSQPQEAQAAPNHANYFIKLREILPLLDPKLVDQTLTDCNNDFDLALDNLLKISSEMPPPAPEPVTAAEVPAVAVAVPAVESSKESGPPKPKKVQKQRRSKPKPTTEWRRKPTAAKKDEPARECEERKAEPPPPPPLPDVKSLRPDPAEEEDRLPERKQDEDEDEEYQRDVGCRAFDNIAYNFVRRHPRYSHKEISCIGRAKKEEVLAGLNEFDGNIIMVREKLVHDHGETCLQPYTEEELAAQSRAELLPTYLKGGQATEEFSEFFLKNHIQEQIWKDLKEHPVDKGAAKSFEHEFPALGPVKSPSRSPAGSSGIWESNHVSIMPFSCRRSTTRNWT